MGAPFELPADEPLEEWRHPTLRDTGITDPVSCRCGRLRDPADMYEVRALGVGEAFLCMACVDDCFRKALFDRMTFYRRSGAPPEFLDQQEQKLLEGSMLRPGLPEEIWGAILAVAMDDKLTLEEAKAAEDEAQKTEGDPPKDAARSPL